MRPLPSPHRARVHTGAISAPCLRTCHLPTPHRARARTTCTCTPCSFHLVFRFIGRTREKGALGGFVIGCVVWSSNGLDSGASFDYRLRQQTDDWQETQVHVNGALTTERISCGQKSRLCIGRGQKPALCIGAGQKSRLCIGPKITLQRLKMQTSL